MLKIVKKILKNNKAFTLVDLLVSISIIAILSTIMLADFHKYGQDSKLEMVAQEMASNFRIMQNNALGLKEYDGERMSGGWGIFACGGNSTGWGDKYVLFANKNQSNPDNECEDGRYDETTEKFKEVNLPEGIVFDNSFLFSNAPTSVSRRCFHVLFIPPLPQTCISGFQSDSMNASIDEQESVSIIIKDEKTNKTKNIIVNKHGLIDVE